MWVWQSTLRTSSKLYCTYMNAVDDMYASRCRQNRFHQVRPPPNSPLHPPFLLHLSTSVWGDIAVTLGFFLPRAAFHLFIYFFFFWPTPVHFAKTLQPSRHPGTPTKHGARSRFPLPPKRGANTWSVCARNVPVDEPKKKQMSPRGPSNQRTQKKKKKKKKKRHQEKKKHTHPSAANEVEEVVRNSERREKEIKRGGRQAACKLPPTPGNSSVTVPMRHCTLHEKKKRKTEKKGTMKRKKRTRSPRGAAIA
ncbi:hypothetical protein JOL62DRAFT_350226 [Phyllosticta paracitricarpa]|uniref:Uncharacterized protein n=1 Tax=Phyllosticta paracitricarpa TaxID=2016321 RepID=A0ABR1NFM4_9PEZI